MKKEYGVWPKILMWFVIWTLINSALYLIASALLPKIFSNAHFFQVQFIYFLIFGLFFSISSRIIYSLIHKNRIYIGGDVFFFWTFAYAFAIWLSNFLKNYFITDLSASFLSNKFIGILFVGLGVCIIIRIIQRMEFGRLGIKSPLSRAPSQIFTGIILIVFGILCWRFSTIVFIDWFNWIEGMAWSWLIGLGFMIAGVLVLIAWWRNNVANFNFHGHWWNH